MNVSILVCTYGPDRWRELARERAIPSAAIQQPFEIVVVHQADGTLAGARNRGAGYAAGDWLCFLDADDALAPGYLAAMAACEPEGPALLMPAVSYHRGDGTVTEPEIPNAGRWPRINEGVIGTLVPADLFAEVGGFREFSCYEDWDLWLRCEKAGARIVHAPQAVYQAYTRGTRPAGFEASRNLPAQDVREQALREIWLDYAGTPT